LCSEEQRDDSDVSVVRSLENIDLSSGGDLFVTSVLDGVIYRISPGGSSLTGFSGTLTKRMGLAVVSTKTENGERTYTIAS
jgi:hypothetical protein